MLLPINTRLLYGEHLAFPPQLPEVKDRIHEIKNFFFQKWFKGVVWLFRVQALIPV